MGPSQHANLLMSRQRSIWKERLTRVISADDKGEVNPNSSPAGMATRLADRARATMRELRAELCSSNGLFRDDTLVVITACLVLIAAFLVLASVQSGAGPVALVAAALCACAAAWMGRLLVHRLRVRRVTPHAGSPRRMGEAELLGELADPDVTLQRSRALVRRLRRVGTNRSVPVLLECAGSSDINLSLGAVLALARIGSDEAVDALIECLGMEAGPRLTTAARSLSRQRSRRAMPALRDCLESRGEVLRRGQRRILILALGGVPHVSAVPVLSEALSDRSHRMRNAAAWALAQIRAPESAAALEAAIAELSWLRAIPARRGLRALRRRDDHG